MNTTAENAQLALLLEVASAPKPGNVDRHHDYPDLQFEHFLAGAVGASAGLRALADESIALGSAFEDAVEGMSHQSGGNTQFGAVLLLAPLVRAASQGDLSPEGASAVVEATTVDDAAGFYRAFDHVDVAVNPPPEDLDDLDVRRGSDAVPAVHEREVTWEDLMAESASRDGIAAEWVDGFPRTFAAADGIASAEGPVTDRAATVFLELLAEEVDTFVGIQHDRETGEEVRQRAAAALEGSEDVEALADEFVERGINPGTTADLIAGGLFVALERGLEV